uniref:Uncharacterized protein n=1 Tax=Pipistrellus kuhlii TaxID=59472 RepID=A0A7J7U9Y8_PIPKU|nr:hypothetical protein mPipKuh1_009150 [Pipistrellus kuhlii]
MTLTPGWPRCSLSGPCGLSVSPTGRRWAGVGEHGAPQPPPALGHIFQGSLVRGLQGGMGLADEKDGFRSWRSSAFKSRDSHHWWVANGREGPSHGLRGLGTRVSHTVLEKWPNPKEDQQTLQSWHWTPPSLLHTLGASQAAPSGALRAQVQPSPGSCNASVPGVWKDRVSCSQILSLSTLR